LMPDRSSTASLLCTPAGSWACSMPPGFQSRQFLLTAQDWPGMLRASVRDDPARRRPSEPRQGREAAAVRSASGCRRSSPRAFVFPMSFRP